MTQDSIVPLQGRRGRWRSRRQRQLTGQLRFERACASGPAAAAGMGGDCRERSMPRGECSHGHRTQAGGQQLSEFRCPPLITDWLPNVVCAVSERLEAGTVFSITCAACWHACGVNLSMLPVSARRRELGSGEQHPGLSHPGAGSAHARGAAAAAGQRAAAGRRAGALLAGGGGDGHMAAARPAAQLARLPQGAALRPRGPAPGRVQHARGAGADARVQRHVCRRW
jgi:hypothetical protein